MAAATLIAGLHLALAIAGVRSIPDAELLGQAETAFHAGITVRDDADKARPLLGKAASCYERLRLRGAHNADLYRNQGNSYLLAGDLPRAILAYRRGLRLAPTDPILRANLAHARDQVAYPGWGNLGRPPADNWPPWLPYLSSSQRLLLFFCAYSLGWLGIVRWWMVRQSTPLIAGILGFGVAILLASSLALQEWSEREATLHPLVVLATDNVFLRRGNGPLYPPRFETPLNRGVEARLLFARGDWLQIELSGGQAGWVPSAAVLLDTP
jgi:tetratricopeptide (TPR) repeat protein